MTAAQRRAAIEHAKLMMAWEDEPADCCGAYVSLVDSRGERVCWWHWRDPIQLVLA